MAKTTPTPEAVSKVETELWNTIRAIETLERQAEAIALKTDGEVNCLAEGIAGIAALAVSHIRHQQVELGGAE